MAAPLDTFAKLGRSLGLDDGMIFEALARAIRAAGPGVGGRYIAFDHRIERDLISRVAVEELVFMSVTKRLDSHAGNGQIRRIRSYGPS